MFFSTLGGEVTLIAPLLGIYQNLSCALYIFYIVLVHYFKTHYLGVFVFRPRRITEPFCKNTIFTLQMINDNTFIQIFILFPNYPYFAFLC